MHAVICVLLNLPFYCVLDSDQSFQIWSFVNVCRKIQIEVTSCLLIRILWPQRYKGKLTDPIYHCYNISGFLVPFCHWNILLRPGSLSLKEWLWELIGYGVEVQAKIYTVLNSVHYSIITKGLFYECKELRQIKLNIGACHKCKTCNKVVIWLIDGR